MASTLNTPHLDKKASQSMCDADNVSEDHNQNQMSDDDDQTSTPSKFYDEQIHFLLNNNKLDLAQQSLKQIAKILQSISKKPGDKKVRQHPMQGIIMKKFVSGLEGGISLMNILGFEETNIDGKPYLQLADDHQTITDAEGIADALLDAATNTTPEKLKSTSGGGGAAAKADAPSTPDAKPVKCARDCGFWGNPKTNNLCSSCYKTHLLENPPLQRSTPLIKGSSLSNKCVSKGCRNKYVPSAATAEDAFSTPVGTPIPSPLTTSLLNPLRAAAIPLQKPRYCELCGIAAKHKRRSPTRQEKWTRARAKLRSLYYINSCRKPIQHDRERCWTCNRKMNLSGIECRCGYVFCGRHRYAQEHDCTYDHYKRHQTRLEKYNTVVGRSKLEHQEDDYD